MGPSTTPIVQQKKIKLEGGGVLRGGGRDDERAILKSETRSPTSTAPNKGAPRIAQKCFTKYLKTAAKAQANPLAFINDMVRGTMAFTSCGEMLRALEAIETMQGRRLGDGSLAYAEFQIVRAKQIYEPKSPLLYGDIKLNIRVHTDPAGGEAAPPHNCELQLNIVPMLEGKGTPVVTALTRSGATSTTNTGASMGRNCRRSSSTCLTITAPKPCASCTRRRTRTATERSRLRTTRRVSESSPR